MLRYLSIPLLALAPGLSAQFIDTFDGDSTAGWERYTGDGVAEIDFTPGNGLARIEVDATRDPHNVWWAIIKRDVSSFLDMEKLQDPAYELRVEIRLRSSHAPRRVNIMINTQRTVDFHKQLREYDIPRAGEWRTISMTTQDLDAKPGDQLNVQLGITDWGHDTYQVELDSYKAEVVEVARAAPDLGEPLVYHPPIPDLDSFDHHLPVAHDALINTRFPRVSFSDWAVGGERALTVSSDQFPILRWDFNDLDNATADGAGILELTTHSVAKGGDYSAVYGEDLGMEFGKVRIIEILGGDPHWQQDSVTYQSFTGDKDLSAVVNGQMTFDTELSPARGGKTYATLPRPVMQRLLDGTTRGLIIKPLGAIAASLYDSEHADGEYAPNLRFNTK